MKLIRGLMNPSVYTYQSGASVEKASLGTWGMATAHQE